MEIITAGRTDIGDYFKLSGVMEHKKLSHTPFLVFVEGKANEATREAIERVEDNISANEYITRPESYWARSSRKEDIARVTETKKLLKELEKELAVFREKVKDDSPAILVKIVDSVKDLLEYPDEVKVMGQWGGRWSSDFFQFTVGDLRDYVEKNPE